MILKPQDIQVWIYTNRKYTGMRRLFARLHHWGIPCEGMPDGQAASLQSSVEPDIPTSSLLQKLELASDPARLPVLVTDHVSLAQAAMDLSIACIGLAPLEYLTSTSFPCDILTDAPESLSPRQLIRLACHKAGLPACIGYSKRLGFREFTEQDAPAIRKLYTEEISRYMDPPADFILTSKEALSAYVKEVYPFYDYGLYGVYEKTSPGRLIGCMGFYEDTLSLSHSILPAGETLLSYFISEHSQHQGYAKEGLRFLLHFAFFELKKERLFALIDKSNQASLHLIRQLSFQLHEKNIRYRQRSCLLFLLTREEFRLAAARDKIQAEYRQVPEKTVYSKHYPKTSS